MQLSELLQGYIQLSADQDVRVTDLCILSQDCVPGAVFFELKNPSNASSKSTNKQDFVSNAIANGAIAVIREGAQIAVEQHNKYLIITLPNLRSQLAVLAQKFYQPNFDLITCIGITGTNGKTSCAKLIAEALSVLGYKAAMIGTLGAGFLDSLQETGYTTPDIFTVYKHIAEFIADQAQFVVMEVSSHALEQYRVAGVPFKIAVLTNISRDHLDYHQTMENYVNAKKKLFANPDLECAVINSDDAYSADFFTACSDKTNKIGFSQTKQGNYSRQLNFDYLINLLTKNKTPKGYELVFSNQNKFNTKLLGGFNIANLLAVSAVLIALQVPENKIFKALENLTPVRGRLETINIDAKPLCVIDYAHTPDALIKALQACREFTKEKLICVFGCGGDRDQGKRALMAKAAEEYADEVVVTSDNSRTESVNAIFADISTGFRKSFLDNHVNIIEDREEAIKFAIQNASQNDVVLIAGKGHETYQITGAEKLKFCDVSTAKQLLLSGEKD